MKNDLVDLDPTKTYPGLDHYSRNNETRFRSGDPARLSSALFQTVGNKTKPLPVPRGVLLQMLGEAMQFRTQHDEAIKNLQKILGIKES